MLTVHGEVHMLTVHGEVHMLTEHYLLCAFISTQDMNGKLVAEQISVDHNTENEGELARLAEVGLDPHTLLRYKRLGTQQNTRSIGDYSIKGGYKDIDTIAWVRDSRCA